MRVFSLAIFGIVLAGLVLASASAAQVGAPPSGKPGEKQQPANCSVSGQVVSAADSAPLKSSRVALIQEDSGSKAQAFSATTDGDGRFDIRKVVPGRYSFFAVHTGYIDQRYQARGMNGGTALTLAPGQEVDGVLFRLVRGAVITGRIVDENGEPMAKVAIAALRKLTAEEHKEDSNSRTRNDRFVASTALTDDRGEYRIFDLRPGEYYVKAEESDAFGLGSEDGLNWITRDTLGSQYAPVFYPGVAQLDQAQTVTLSAGEEARAEFAMRPVKTVEVAGRVLGVDGKPASGALVLLYIPEEASWANSPNTNTNAKGEFTIKGVPPGSYIVSAQRVEEGKRLFTQQKLEVGNENIDSVLLAFSLGTTVRGRIVGLDASIPEQIQVALAPAHEGDLLHGGSAVSKPDGSFQIEGVGDGDFSLWVSDLEQGWYVRSARLGGDDVLEKGVQVEKGSVGGNLEIVLSSAGAQLEGTVTDHDKPAGGAEIWLKPEPETPYNPMRSRSANTDQNGHFTFRTLPPGKYRVIAKLAGASPETPASASEPKIVTLGERDHQNLQLTLAAEQNQ